MDIGNRGTKTRCVEVAGNDRCTKILDEECQVTD